MRFTYAGGITGTGSLTKSGAGNLVLSGTNSYTGPTSVAAGRLSVGGGLANTAVTVASAAELGGSGSIVGALTVNNGGTLAPGNSIAALSVGDTTFDGGSTFAYEVDSTNVGSLGSAADLLVVGSDLDIAAGTVLSFTDLNNAPNAFADGTIFALINYSGTWDGGVFTFNSQSLADGDRFFVGAEEWQIDYNSPTGGLNFTSDYVSGSFVTVTAVPEPTTLAILAAAGCLAAIRRYRA